MSSNLFVSSSSSLPLSSSSSSWPTTLEACECVRESKRAQLSVLFTRQQAIARAIQALERELNSLDEHMDQLYDALQEQQQQQEEEEELPETNDDTTIRVQRHCHSPLTTTQCSPSDTCTDPTTVAPGTQQQQQQQQQQKHPQNDDDAAQFMQPNDNVPAFFQPRRVTNIQPAPLERMSHPPRHDNNDSSSSNNQASTATTTTVHMSLSVATTTTTTTAAATTTTTTSSTNNASSKQHRYHDEVHRLLRQTFGLNNFRHQQQDIIYATLDNKDVFVVMRTGGGKSLTYQLPALLQRPKITLVVSPLVSLMADQVQHMNDIAGPGTAVCLSAGMGAAASRAAWDAIRNPTAGVCLVLVTPERVHQSTRLRHELQKLAAAKRLARFVIDEAHCASQWGISFRPDYAQLGILKRHFDTVPVLALTATASSVVRSDVCRILGLAADHTRVFWSTANRPNLRYSVRPKPLSSSSSSSSSSSMMMMMVAEMAAFIQQHHAHDSGIIYTLSRKNAESIASALCRDYGIVARAYHSHVRHKENIQRDWMMYNNNNNNRNNNNNNRNNNNNNRNNNNRNKGSSSGGGGGGGGGIQVMVATIAFGLGINKANVRFVLHETMSQNLDLYYQESGRAGRDGQDAHCILWYSPKDVPRIRAMVEDTPGGAENLWPMVRYGQAFGNDEVCRAILLSALGEPNAPSPRQTLQQHGDATTRVKDVGKHGQIVTRLVHEANQSGDQVTQAMVLKTWRATKNVPTYVEEHPPKDLNAFECEQIIVSLLLENILEYHVHWTAYQAVAYLRLGRRGVALLQSANPKMLVRFPLAATSSSSSTTTGNNRKNATAPPAKKTLSTEWVTSGNGKKKPTAKTSKKAAPKKATKKATAAKAVKKTTRKNKTNKKPAAAAAAAVVESNTIQSYLAPKAKEEDVIVLSSDEDDDDSQVFVKDETIAKREPRATRKRSRSEILWEDSKDTDPEEHYDDDDDQEFEF